MGLLGIPCPIHINGRKNHRNFRCPVYFRSMWMIPYHSSYVSLNWVVHVHFSGTLAKELVAKIIHKSISVFLQTQALTLNCCAVSWSFILTRNISSTLSSAALSSNSCEGKHKEIYHVTCHFRSSVARVLFSREIFNFLSPSIALLICCFTATLQSFYVDWIITLRRNYKIMENVSVFNYFKAEVIRVVIAFPMRRYISV